MPSTAPYNYPDFPCTSFIPKNCKVGPATLKYVDALSQSGNCNLYSQQAAALINLARGDCFKAALTAQGITPTVAGICAATNPTKLGNANMSGDGSCTSGLNTYGYPCKPGGKSQDKKEKTTDDDKNKNNSNNDKNGKRKHSKGRNRFLGRTS
ncbi:MAG: hypothetical protein ACKOWF_01020 [Chloroflexota bacterium]